MKYIIALSCLLGCLTWVYGMSTAHPHVEHSEYDSFNFFYDGITKMMLVHNTQFCYIWPITADEMSSVHTDNGMRAIELRVFKEVDASFYTKVPENILAPTIVRGCKTFSHHPQMTTYYLVH